MTITWKRSRHEKYVYHDVTDLVVLSTCIQFTCVIRGKTYRLTNPKEGKHLIDGKAVIE
jgi:hypothetical protein